MVFYNTAAWFSIKSNLFEKPAAGLRCERTLVRILLKAVFFKKVIFLLPPQRV